MTQSGTTMAMKRTNTKSLVSIGAWLLMACGAGAAQDIVPGALWPDHRDVHINAHGGGMLVHNGQTYMLSSGCTGWAPNAARLAVADSIWGPWKALGNPCTGVNPENDLGPEKTFGAQSTYVLPVPGKQDAFIAMFDMWRPRNPVDGRYIWLPIQFTESGPSIRWQSTWNMTTLDQ
jgi:hypothetical protein